MTTRSRRLNVKCHYCDAYADTVDHIVPKFLGGKDRLWNRVPSCYECNSAKGADMPECTCPLCLWAVHRYENGERTQRVTRPQRVIRRKTARTKKPAAWRAHDTVYGETLSGMTRDEWMAHERLHVPKWML